MILLLLGAIVFQNGDTLFFMEESVYLDTVVMQESFIDGNRPTHFIEKAKVSSDGGAYLEYCAVYTWTMPETLLTSSITFYDAEKNKLYEEKIEGKRSISYDLCDIHDSLMIIATWNDRYRDPALYVVRNGERWEIIKQGDWERIVSYVVSANGRYILFHTRNPYHDKPWDYIFFYDLESSATWDYLFPSCLSCKKSRIYLDVDNDGQSRVVHKNEHRVFSPEGVLEDIYLKSR